MIFSHLERLTFIWALKSNSGRAWLHRDVPKAWHCSASEQQSQRQHFIQQTLQVSGKNVVKADLPLPFLRAW